MTTPNLNPLASHVQNLIKEQVKQHVKQQVKNQIKNQVKTAGRAVVQNVVAKKLHPEAQRTIRIVSDFVKNR